MINAIDAAFQNIYWAVEKHRSIRSNLDVCKAAVSAHNVCRVISYPGEPYNFACPINHLVNKCLKLGPVSIIPFCEPSIFAIPKTARGSVDVSPCLRLLGCGECLRRVIADEIARATDRPFWPLRASCTGVSFVAL